MSRFLTTVACLVALAGRAASADTIQLATATSVVAPLNWDPSSAVSPPLLISIISDTAPPADSLTSWQLRLIVVPSAAATGLGTFNDARFPSDYLLAGSSSGDLGLLLLGQELFASDFDDVDPVTGVPAVSGNNLLELDLTRSANANGRFDIYAVAAVGFDSFWSDQDFLPRTFGPDGNLYLGSVSLVHEPASAILLGIACAALGLSRCSRRR